MNKFDFVPLDEGTVITLSIEKKFNDFDVLFQKWTYEGVQAESLIFANADRDHLTDDLLFNMVRDDPINTGGDPTIKRTDNYTFVNFNFVIR